MANSVIDLIGLIHSLLLGGWLWELNSLGPQTRLIGVELLKLGLDSAYDPEHLIFKFLLSFVWERVI